MLRPALSALAHVHGHAFFHGHLKPANVLAVDGQLRSRATTSAESGTPRFHNANAYTPLEIEGISPAGGVWSLGMTLVEALTQRLPALRLTSNMNQLSQKHSRNHFLKSPVTACDRRVGGRLPTLQRG